MKLKLIYNGNHPLTIEYIRRELLKFLLSFDTRYINISVKGIYNLFDEDGITLPIYYSKFITLIDMTKLDLEYEVYLFIEECILKYEQNLDKLHEWVEDHEGKTYYHGAYGKYLFINYNSISPDGGSPPPSPAVPPSNVNLEFNPFLN